MFWKNKRAYDHQMRVGSVPSGQQCLSCDHTFKTLSNIGIVRSDGKWVGQYNGLFCVLNSDGEVLTWKFTNIIQLNINSIN